MISLTNEIVSQDSLSGIYADRWDGTSDFESANFLMQMLASNDLIYVVLAVSLIIWLVLAFYLIKVDKKLSGMEENLKSLKSKE